MRLLQGPQYTVSKLHNTQLHFGCHAAPNTTRVSSCGPTTALVANIKTLPRRALSSHLFIFVAYRSVEYCTRNSASQRHECSLPSAHPGLWYENTVSPPFNKLSPQDSAHVPEVGSLAVL
jgi:hypothetical protein